MTQDNSRSLRTFMIIWSGQSVSIIGTVMTGFALNLWAWELTGQATALALVIFFMTAPQALIALFAGVIVDRWNRKVLLMAGDSAAGLTTLVLLLLFSKGQLQIWHVYIGAAINGTFGYIQMLTYLSSVSMLMPKKHYARATSMTFLSDYGANLIGPALAGVLYPLIGLTGIMTIDITTCIVAVTSVALVHIPRPLASELGQQRQTGTLKSILFGFRYIFARPSLTAMLIATSSFFFAHDLGNALYTPMVLARTNSSPEALAAVTFAAGVGGVIGSLIISTWGGPKRRIHGYLLSKIGAGLSKIVFGLGRSLSTWVPAQISSSLNFPMMGGSRMGIWMSKVEPDLQGRVFASRHLVMLGVSSVATLVAGPLADHVFEPAMQPGGALAPLLGGVFGSGPGAGMAIIYVFSAFLMMMVGVVGFMVPRLRNVEDLLPDHDAASDVQPPAMPGIEGAELPVGAMPQ